MADVFAKKGKMPITRSLYSKVKKKTGVKRSEAVWPNRFCIPVAWFILFCSFLQVAQTWHCHLTKLLQNDAPNVQNPNRLLEPSYGASRHQMCTLQM